jgi:HSP20 family molecular chaperone IbpA
MALTLLNRRDPFAEFDALIRQAFPAPTTRRTAARPAFSPAADIVRDGDDAVIAIDAPGLDFERDITVELDGTSLVVSGERRDERTDTVPAEGADTDGAATGVVRLRTEVRYGAFRRSFTLPEHVTADALTATYDAGVLTVRVAGAYAGSEPQKIAVTGGKAPAAIADTVDAEQ